MGKQPNYLPSRHSLLTDPLHFESADFAKKYPALYQLMCYRMVDGKYRAGARLTLFCEDGKLKASIRDPDTAQSWFATLEAFEGALEAVEAILQRSGGEWREWRDAGAKR